ncbi:MAG: TlpA family protein disulfide reductase [Labilithrix sp.]|nr:TlpA family protein disulfide reductase [Labilithrix sp.]
MALAGCTNEAKSPTGGGGGGEGKAEVGKPAPELSIETLNDKGTISLNELQGKVVIVDFWATWCAPCKQSFPKLEELQKKVGDKVVIVGVSVDDEKKGVAEFAKENGATFAIGWDQGHTIASRWKVGTMPTTFVVDATGKVRHIHDGYHEGETDRMEKEANALLAEDTGDTKVAKNDAKAEDPDAKGDKGDKGGDTKADTAKPDDKPPPDEDDPPPKEPKKKKKPKKKKSKKP